MELSAIGTVEESDEGKWMRILDINLVGVARVSAAAPPWRRKSKVALIVSLGSITALDGLPHGALHAACEGCILALTYTASIDPTRGSIRVNCVSPEAVYIAFVERMLQKFENLAQQRAALDARLETSRMVKPEEVADAIVNLANPGQRARLITYSTWIGESARCSSGHSRRPKDEAKDYYAKNRFGFWGQHRWSGGLQAASRRRVAHVGRTTASEQRRELFQLSALRDAALLHGMRSRVGRSINLCRSGHVGVSAAADDRSSAR